MLGVQVMARDPLAVQASAEVVHHAGRATKEYVGVRVERSGLCPDPFGGQSPAVAAEGGMQVQSRLAGREGGELAEERRPSRLGVQ
jgi:hypothetical protein